MQISVYEYDECLLLFETRGLVGKNGVDRNVSNEYYTTDGMIKGGKFYPKDGGKAESVSGGEPRQVTGGGCFGAFITAMRSRKPEDNNADAEVAHYSSALCHLGNIAFRMGEPMKFNKEANEFDGNKEVADSLKMLKDNLKAVDVDLDNTTYQVGPKLEFNPKAEKFVNNDKANDLLSREYRKPFEVPEKV
jgi:hypothetical protein